MMLVSEFFLIVHSLNKMIKDVDAVFRYIDFLMYKYLVAAFIMCTDDVRRRPFAYKFGVFFYYSNPRHVKHVDVLPKHTTVSPV